MTDVTVKNVFLLMCILQMDETIVKRRKQGTDGRPYDGSPFSLPKTFVKNNNKSGDEVKASGGRSRVGSSSK
jgi:hypothetical protein